MGLGVRILRGILEFLFPFPRADLVFTRHAADRFEERIGRLPSFRGLVGAVVYVYESDADRSLWVPLGGFALVGVMERGRRGRERFVAKTVLPSPLVPRGALRRVRAVRVASVRLPRR